MMLAYSHKDIEALRHHVKAKTWLRNGIISKEEHDSILKEFPCRLYRVKIAFRILLFLAAIICVQGIIGLMGVAFIEAFEDYLYIPLWIIGLLLMVVNEFMFIKEKFHFRTGLVQGVYYSGLAYILGGVVYLIQDFNAPLTIIFTLLFLIISIRYLDRFALILSILSLNATIFLIFNNFDGNARFIVPFILALVNGGVYMLIRKVSEEESLKSWREMTKLGQYLALILAYLSLNLFVVQEGANNLLGLQGDVPFRWLFILFTVLIPFVYLFIGIKNKDRMFLRTGMATLALGIASIKYYYSTGHHEITFTLTGIIILAMAIYLIRKYKKPIHGITSEKVEGKGSALFSVLLAAQAEGQSELPKPEDGIMGGGQFGGGGSGTSY